MAEQFWMPGDAQRLSQEAESFLQSDAPDALFALFPRPMSLSSSARLGHCAGDGESREKQVAMIAQKVIDAKHAEQERRRFIAAPDSRTPTLRTMRLHHMACPP